MIFLKNSDEGDVTNLEVSSRQLPCLGNNQGCARLCRSVTHCEREKLRDLCKQSQTLQLSPQTTCNPATRKHRRDRAG